MRKYEKPVIEVFELRPEERLAGSPTKYVGVTSNDDGKLFNYTIFDDGKNKNGIEGYDIKAQDNSQGGFSLGESTKSFRQFLSWLGLDFGFWRP